MGLYKAFDALSETPLVLELQRVTQRPAFESGLELLEVDLELHAGELLTIQVDAATRTRSFASLIQGILHPEAGVVRFLQQDWRGSNYQRHFWQRSLIGRVFEGQAWIENLNVDENVTLAARHHGMQLSDITSSIQHWCNYFGMDKLASRRPAFVAPATLQIHQWIRAFLGNPKLVILESPLQYVAQNWVKVFLDAVAELMSRGTAVLWLDSRTDLPFSDVVGPCQRLRADQGKLHCMNLAHGGDNE